MNHIRRSIFPVRNFSKNIFENNFTKFLAVHSVNYDFIPMSLDSPKQLWVDLTRPPPSDFRIGGPVQFQQGPGIRKKIFKVGDIIGSRVMLLPYTSSDDSGWLPTDHSCRAWGYDTTTLNVSPSHHGVGYGYGYPRAQIQYIPFNSGRMSQYTSNPENYYYAVI